MTEDDVEKSAIAWLQDLGYAHVRGPELSPGGAAPERASYGDVVLEGRLLDALARLNPHLDADTLDTVARDVARTTSPSIEEANARFHKWLIEGYELQRRHDDGTTRGDRARLIAFGDDEVDLNDWLVVDQLTFRQGRHTRRTDLVVYLNGLPVALIELKHPEDRQATLRKAWKQIQTYKAQIPALFHHNALVVLSDGLRARVGSLTAGFERYGPWKTLDGESPAPAGMPELEVLLRGLLRKDRLLHYLRHFILWETTGDSTADHVKKIAGYHQFHAVRRALDATLVAAAELGDRRIGVVWHTQGSGKSLSMVFYAGKLVVEPAMGNPTIVVVTDRNDLDGQLLRQFAKAELLVRGAPEQAEDREHLRDLLRVASGGIVFTTVQKWSLSDDERKAGQSFPVLSKRRNVVVIADEAHRSQYGFGSKVDPETGKISIGFARNLRDGLPNASFLGFTGTPIDFDDRSTPAIFGDYVHTYTMRESIADEATVPLHYEARLARITLPGDTAEHLDDDFDQVTEGQEDRVKSELASKWARLEAMVGNPDRLKLVARDIVEHWQRRTEILEGKAMVVTMSRRIAVELYDAILELRPEWRGTGPDGGDTDGALEVVITASSSDDEILRLHRRTRKQLEALEKRFKDPDDPFQMVIVRDMWLTGFDAPSAHTLYVDKPMQGHGLMQSIARVNRVFRDKPAGLVVDYIGLAEPLRKAVSRYGGRHDDPATVPVEDALRALEHTFGVVRDLFHGFDDSAYFGDDPTRRLRVLAAAVDHVLGLPSGRRRFLDAMAALEKAAAIALHLEEARPKRDAIGFYQGVRANLHKYTLDAGSEGQREGDGYGRNDASDLDALDAAIRQIVTGAVASDGVIDIFAAAGVDKPDLSILSDEFLGQLTHDEHPNLQLALLQKLLNDEIRSLSRRNVVQARRFSEMLRRTLFAYQNRTLESAQVILQLISLAKELRDAPDRAKALGVTADEMAFYDALADHGDVRDIMGDDVLAIIARDLVAAIRRSVTLDWTQKEAVRADLRRKVKRLLRKHGYPPDQRAEAVDKVLTQAETLCRDWAELPIEERGAAPGDEAPLPFQVVPREEVQPYENAVPLYGLEVAAGRLDDPQTVDESHDAIDWVRVDGRDPAPGLFVAKVVGESMNRRIPNGAYCLFRRDPAGTRQGKVVLVRGEDLHDPETGAAYTVKRYESEKRQTGDGWRHERVILRPESTDPAFVPIVIEGESAESVRIVAELLEVLGGARAAKSI